MSTQEFITTTGLTPIEESIPLKQTAYRLLQRMIISGELKPGDRLREVALSEMFSMSRGPIREAMQMLVSDNWLHTVPRHGVYVKNPDVQEIENYFDVKKLLEVESARLAAQNISSEMLDHLEELVERGFIALRNGEELFDLNVEFHLAISRSSGNSVLSDLVERVEKQFRFYFVLVRGLRNEDAWLEHEEMVRALQQRNADKAGILMQEHTQQLHDAFRNSKREAWLD